MEICIDTKKDSPEDIKKAIEFLQKFTSNESSSSEFSLGSSPSTAMSNIFGDDSGMGSMTNTTSSNITDNKNEKKKFSDDEVRIIPY